MNPEDETLGEGRFLRLVSRRGWEYVERSNATGVVVVAAINRTGEAIFVEQFRPPLGVYVIEWPAGLVGDDPGERDEPLERAAARELEEETGYRAGSIEAVSEGPSSAGMSSEIVTFLIARDLERVGEGGGVSSEQITVHHVPFREARFWLEAQQTAGKLVDPKVYTGLYFLEHAEREQAAGI